MTKEQFDNLQIEQIKSMAVYIGMKPGVCMTKKPSDLQAKILGYMTEQRISMDEIDYDRAIVDCRGMEKPYRHFDGETNVNSEPKEELITQAVYPKVSIPESIATDRDFEVTTTIKRKDTLTDIYKYPRKRVIVFSAEQTEDAWTYFGVGNYNCQVIFGEEVDLPVPVIEMIDTLKSYIYRKDVNGFTVPKEVKKYVVNYVD